VLHFDVNETILVGDPAGGDTFEDSCNKVLAKSAAVRLAQDGSMLEQWYDGSPIAPHCSSSSSPPPPYLDWTLPPGCGRYYELCAEDKRAVFADDGEAGAQYRPLRDQMVNRLAWPANALTAADSRLCKHGRHYLIPAFFRTISTLATREREFTIVIRTFVRAAAPPLSTLHAYAGQSTCPSTYTHVALAALGVRCTW
jgi:hypothetical protein